MLRRIHLALVALLIVVAAARLPVAFDEAYYWTWSRALAFSYLDHPPAIAWAIAAFGAVFGDGLLGLRVLSLGCMVVVVAASVASVRRLVPEGERDEAAYLVVLTLAGAMMFVVGYLPATPDPLQGAVLALAAHAVVRATTTRGGAPLFVAGALLVGGVVVKHSSALVAFGAFVSLLLARPRDLARPAPWLGALVGAILVVPWLAADADGATAYQSARVFEAAKTRGLLGIPLTIGAMLLTLGAPFTVALLGQTLRGVRAEVAPLYGGAATLVAGCMAAAWLGTGEINWVMPALVFALPAVVARLLATKRWVRPYTIVTAVTSAVWLVGLLHVAYPFLPFAPGGDRTLRSSGFDAVAARAEALAERHGAHTLIARRYQVASMMRFHLRDRIRVRELGTSRRSQYDRWPRPPLCKGDVAIVVMPDDARPNDVTPIAAPERVMRERGGRELGAYVVTPVRVDADIDCRGAP